MDLRKQKQKTSASEPFAVVVTFVLMMIVFGFWQFLYSDYIAMATVSVPKIISFQGKLTDNNRITVADTARNMKFQIWDSATSGTCLWSAANTDANTATVDCTGGSNPGSISITTTDGVFFVLLGDTTGGTQNAFPSTLFDNSNNLWLGITVGTDSEMTPRIRLATVPFAMDADLLDGYDSSQAGGNSVVLVSDSSGNLTLTGSTFTCPDCIDYDDMSDALTLDASTSIAMSGSQTYTVTDSGTGNVITNLASTGDFVIQDNGTGVFIVQDDSTITHSPSNISGALGAGSLTGLWFSQGQATYTATSGSNDVSFNTYRQPTLAASGSTTVTNAATLRIADAPSSGTNMTITNPWALWIDDGNTRFDGAILDNPANATTVSTSLSTGSWFSQAAHTGTINAVSVTIPASAFNTWAQPTLDASGSGVIVTDAANLYIANAPNSGSGNLSITNPWSLWVDNGNVRFDGDLQVNGGNLTTSAATGALFNTTATTVNVGGAAGSGGVNLAGGSGSTGCTVDGTNGNLTCSGTVTGSATSGTQGFWSRSGTTLSPATSGDLISATGGVTVAADKDITMSSGAGVFTQTSTATSTAAHSVIANALSTGTGILIQGGTSLSANGELLDLDLNGGTAGAAATIHTAGVYTGGGVVQILANNATSGTGEFLSMSGLTNGTALSIAGGSSMASGGKLIDVSMGGATDGNGVVISDSGAYVGTGLLSVSSTTMTTGSLVNLSATSTPTSGAAVNVNRLAVTDARSTSGGTTNGLDYSFTNQGAVAHTQNAFALHNALTTSFTDSTTETLLLLDQADTTTSGTTAVTDGLKITSATSGITNGIQIVGTNVTNGITMTTAPSTNYVNSGNWTVTSAGAQTLASDSAVNGSNITTTNTGTFNLINTNATTLNVGGATTTLNLAGGTGGTGCTIDGSGNLDCTGTLTIGGATFTGTGVTTFNCSDCIDFDDMKDSLSLDASTSIATSGSQTLTFTDGGTGNIITNLASTGDYTVQYAGKDILSVQDAGYVRIGGGTGTNSTEGLVIDVSDVTGVAAEQRAMFGAIQTIGLTDGTTLANERQWQFFAPSINGVAGGGTETVTNAATLYVNDAPSGADITISNPYALWIDNGNTRFDGDLVTAASTIGVFDTTATTLNLGGATTTLNLAGGSGSTGCTINSSGDLTCTGTVSGSAVGFWNRTGTTLSPTTANDIVSIPNTSTSRTSADLLNVSHTATYTATNDVSGQLLDLSQSLTLSTGAQTLTQSGALATIARTTTRTLGTATLTGGLLSLTNTTSGTVGDSADLLSITQSDTASTGNVLNIVDTSTGTATGDTINVDASATTGLVFDLNADSVNSGTIFDISANGITTGNAINIGSTTTLSSTGALLSISDTQSGGLPNGSLASLTLDHTASGGTTQQGSMMLLTNKDTGGNVTNWSSNAHMLRLDQQDASGPNNGQGAVLDIQNAGDNDLIKLTTDGLQAGFGIEISDNNSTRTSGDLIHASQNTTYATGGVAVSGNLADLSQILSDSNTSGTIQLTGPLETINRQTTTTGAGGTTIVSGTLLTLQDTSVQSAGTLTNNSNLLTITQGYSSATGDPLVITNAGTGESIFVDANGNTATAPTDAVGGAIHLTNTGNANLGLSVYSNHSSGAGAPLVEFKSDNAAFDQAVLRVNNNGGTGNTTLLVDSTDTTGIAFDLNTTALSTGNAIDLTNASNTRTSGDYIHVAQTAANTGTLDVSGNLADLSQALTTTAASSTLTVSGPLENISRTTTINNSTAAGSVTGSVLSLSSTTTSTNSTTTTDSGNLMNITRSTTRGSTGTVTVSGAMLNLSNSVTGTVTDSGTLVNLTQNNTGSTGDVFKIVTGGTGSSINIDAATTDSTLTGATNGVMKLTVDASPASAATNQGIYEDYETIDDANANQTFHAFNIDFLNSSEDAGDTTRAMNLVNINNASGTAVATDAMIRINNADTTAASLTAGISIQSTGVADGITDAIDVSGANLNNAIDMGANFALFNGIRMFEGSAGTLTIEDTSGNDLATFVDGGTTGNFTSTGDLTVNGTGTISSSATSADVFTVSDTALTSGSLFNLSTTKTLGASGTADIGIISLTDAGSNTSAGEFNGIDYKWFNQATAAHTQNAFTIRAQDVGSFTDTTTESLLYIVQNDSTASGTTVVTSGVKIDSTGNSGMTNGLALASANITNGINFTATPATNFITTASGTFVVSAAGDTTVHLVVASGANGPFALCHETNGAGTQQIKDCNGAPTADYAEQYPVETGATYGDIMATGTTPVTTTAGDTVTELVKSTSAYQGNLIGVITNNTSDFTSAGYNINAADNPMQVALSGRVLVHVTDENGAIAVGDPITSSVSTPGYGMKSTAPGMIVGTALQAFAGPGSGEVMVFVNTHWSAGDIITADGSATAISTDTTIASTGTADATTTAFDSHALALRGSAWDGMAAQDEQMSFVTDVTDTTNYRLSIKNTADTEVAYLTNTGTLEVAGDMIIGGKIYPSNMGVVQTDKYIYYDGSGGFGGDFMRTNASGWGTGSYDFAEMFPSDQKLTSGDVVVFADKDQQVKRSFETNDQKIAGIVSTRPGFLAGDDAPNLYPVALAGRVPTKVTTENGSIAIGDPLTTSSKEGYAMKATESGPIVGYALEPYDGSGKDDLIVAFVHVGYWAGEPTSQTPGTNNTASGFSSTTDVARLNMNGNIYMNGYQIVGIGALAGISDRWSVNEDGLFATRQSYDVVVESYQNEDVVTHATLSTENTISLSGSGKLTAGTATIHFEDVDPTFNDVISNVAPARVLVTLRGEANGVYVTDVTSDGFTVHETMNGGHDADFDWLVEAYRKDREPAKYLEPQNDPTTTTDTTVTDAPAPTDATSTPTDTTTADATVTDPTTTADPAATDSSTTTSSQTSTDPVVTDATAPNPGDPPLDTTSSGLETTNSPVTPSADATATDSTTM